MRRRARGSPRPGRERPAPPGRGRAGASAAGGWPGPVEVAVVDRVAAHGVLPASVAGTVACRTAAPVKCRAASRAAISGVPESGARPLRLSGAARPRARAGSGRVRSRSRSSGARSVRERRPMQRPSASSRRAMTCSAIRFTRRSLCTRSAACSPCGRWRCPAPGSSRRGGRARSGRACSSVRIPARVSRVRNSASIGPPVAADRVQVALDPDAILGMGAVEEGVERDAGRPPPPGRGRAGSRRSPRGPAARPSNRAPTCRHAGGLEDGLRDRGFGHAIPRRDIQRLKPEVIHLRHQLLHVAALQRYGILAVAGKAVNPVLRQKS